jgi:hypothetical protein
MYRYLNEGEAVERGVVNSQLSHIGICIDMYIDTYTYRCIYRYLNEGEAVERGVVNSQLSHHSARAVVDPALQ